MSSCSHGQRIERALARGLIPTELLMQRNRAWSNEIERLAKELAYALSRSDYSTAAQALRGIETRAADWRAQLERLGI